MTRSLNILLLSVFVVLSAGSHFAGQQSNTSFASERRNFLGARPFIVRISSLKHPPSPTPTPSPTPKKSKGILPDLDWSSNEKSEKTEPAPGPSPDKAAATETAMLEDRVTKLKASLAARQNLTIRTIEPLENLDAAVEIAKKLRLRVNRMRRQLYIPDPKPDAALIQRLTAFQQKWGDLVQPIIQGRPPQTPLSPQRWELYSANFSKQNCDEEVITRRPPLQGMPLVGWAWTCLSDSFFHELSQTEVDVNRILAAKRLEITETLDSAMRESEARLASVGGDIGNHPSPSLFLREITWLLHKVDLVGTALRIKELEYQRTAGSGTPAFRWLLETSSKILRPSSGSGPVIFATPGTKVTAKLDGADSALTVEKSPLERLAKALHEVHYQIERLTLEGDNGGGREAAEKKRRRVLFSIATTAR